MFTVFQQQRKYWKRSFILNKFLFFLTPCHCTLWNNYTSHTAGVLIFYQILNYLREVYSCFTIFHGVYQLVFVFLLAGLVFLSRKAEWGQ